VLHTFRRVTKSAPDELTLWFHTYNLPPMPEVREPIRGKSFTGVAIAYLGDREDAEALLAPFREIPGLAIDLVGDVHLSLLGSLADEPTTPMPGMQRSISTGSTTTPSPGWSQWPGRAPVRPC
jgi:hypothetical protein